MINPPDAQDLPSHLYHSHWIHIIDLTSLSVGQAAHPGYILWVRFEDYYRWLDQLETEWVLASLLNLEGVAILKFKEISQRPPICKDWKVIIQEMRQHSVIANGIIKLLLDDN